MGTVIHGDDSGTGTGWDGQVEFRADLPITIGQPPIGSVYLVEKPTKFLGITTFQSGLYMRDSNTGSLSDWRRLNIAVTLYNSDGSLSGDRIVMGTTSRYSITYDELGGYTVNVKGAGATGDVVSYSIGLAGASWDRTGLAEGSGFVMNISTNEPALEFKQGIGGGGPFTSILKAVTMTGNWTWLLPNKSGTLAIEKGIEGFFLSAKGNFGTGGGWADDGFIEDTPVVLYASNLTERAIFMFYGIARSKFDAINPQVGFVVYSTGAPGGGTEDIVWQLQVRYKADGDALGGVAAETLNFTQTLTTLNANSRQTNLFFTLDRTKIVLADVIHAKLTRLGGDANDTYNSDVGVGQSGMILETLNHNP